MPEPRNPDELDELSRSDEDMQAREQDSDEEFEQLDEDDVADDEVEEG